jgi:hypothetical protein
VKAHPNGAGWTAIFRDDIALSDYAPEGATTIAKLLELKLAGVCGHRGLSCEVRLHSNGAGWSALFVDGVQMSPYREARSESEDLLKEYRERRVCKLAGDRDGRACTIQLHPNGTGWSAVATSSGEILTNYAPEMSETIARLLELQDAGFCRRGPARSSS